MPIGGGGGGGASVTTHATYAGNNVSVPNTGVPAVLTWNTRTDGTALLDLSVPAAPTIIAAGVYCVTAITTPGASMTDGKAYVFTLSINTGPSILVRQTVVIEDAIDFDAHAMVSVTYYMVAGCVLTVEVAQADAGAINFPLEAAYIQRLA